MSSWFIIINIVLIFSLSFVQTQFRTHQKQPYPASTNPFNDDSLIESYRPTPKTASSTHRANEEQLKQFTRLLYDLLNLKEPPNVTIDSHVGTGIPSIVKLEKENIQHNKEIHANQQKNREEIQPTIERAILPGESIPHHTCQRQIAAKFHLNKDNLHNIDCFRFTKSSTESKSLPTNQTIKYLRIYVKKNYFLYNQEHEGIFKPNMFQIYQVYRPTSNDTHHSPLPGLTDTIRLSISEVKQVNHNLFELTIDSNHGLISIQQIYEQFISPWYGLAINHVLQSSWSNFYRRYYSRKHQAGFSRSNDEDYESKESQQQLPYMLVEYGEKIPSLSKRNRATRHTGKATPARTCDPKSPCCRRPLIIDLDQISAFDFVLYPRQLDIGECVGLCGTGSLSSKHIDAKNDQYKNENHSGHQLFLIHRNRNTTQINKPDQQSSHCCSYARTGGFDIMYTTRNGGPIIRKFLPNIVVEECRCGLPATIQQV
jgi:hypothetical protein